MSMRFRITVRGLAIELRGYLDELGIEGQPGIKELAEAMKPFGVVVASEADRDYNPFQPSVEDSMALIAKFVEANNGVDLGDLIESLANLHMMQAKVIQGERALREKAEAELRDRELHHFETEQMLDKDRLNAVADSLENNWEQGDLAGAVTEAVACLRGLAA